MRSLIKRTMFWTVFSVSSAASAEDAMGPIPIDAGAPDLVNMPDAGAADALETAAEAPAPAPEIVLAANPVRSDLSIQIDGANDRIADLIRRNEIVQGELAAMKTGMRLLEARLQVLEEDSRYKLAAAGFGPSFGMGSGSGATFKVQGNLKGFSGFYYFGMGGGVAWSMVIHMGRVRVSPLGFGFMAYQDPGNAFTSRWLKRSLDISFPLSVDVRIWKGITVGVQIVWFIPNPVDVGIAAKNAGESSAENTDPLAAMNSPRDTSDKVLDDSGEVVSRAFGHALKSPRLDFAVKWTFF